MAQELICSLEIAPDVCNDCGHCFVSCATGFKIAEKIRDIIRLKAVPAEFLV